MKFIYIYVILIWYERGNGMSNLPYRKIRRIIGGQMANIQDFPSAACLIIKQSNETEFKGGAVIISEYWALTAAHCMHSVSSNDVLEGVAFIRSNSANWKQHFTEHLIVRSYVHEEYNYILTDYDIAMLKVKEPFNGPNEQPVKLADNNYEYLAGTVATVVGWGTTDPDAVDSFVVDNLRFANIKIINFKDCKDAYNTDVAAITEQMMCALSPGRDACIFDSGGPLYQNNILIGLVSWGSPKCSDILFPGVYTRLSVFRNWINQHLLESTNTDNGNATENNVSVLVENKCT